MKTDIPRPKGETDDNRKPLPAGAEVISASGVRYKIKDSTVGFGGSALIYRANRKGSLRNFILKECYPLSKKFNFVREVDDWIIRPAEADNEAEQYLNLVKKNMRRENQVGQLIANQSGRTVAAWENLDAAKIIIDGRDFDASKNFFIVFEEAGGTKNHGLFLKDLLDECSKPEQEDAPFRCGGLPTPQITVAIMEELLKALRDIHRAGYVHGDINDSNFFLMGCDPPSGDIGVGQLLDFGNAFKLEADGKTLPIKNVFSTPGYWSPEILENIGSLRLSAATDIYSVGCLMLYLLKGMRYKRVCGRTLAKNFSAATFCPVKKIMQCGYRREAAILFSKILNKALAHNPADRYSDAGEMLKEIIFLKKIIAPPKFNLSPNLSRSPYFVKGSRDKELIRLQEDLTNGMHPLWIWGIGGIGKTELAMEFARKQIKNGCSAYLVTFRKSIKDTLLALNFSNWRFEFDGQGDAVEAEYHARLDLLKENYGDALLIVDNFDSDSKTLVELQCESAYKDLLALDLKILFTTRSRPNDSVPELAPLDEENALALFASITKIHPNEEGLVLKLIREVDFHPMTVEILARTLNESWGTITAKDLLFALRTESLHSAKLPAVKHRKVFGEREAKVYGHLRTLFKLFNTDDSYREILCHTTLLPPDGFDAAEFILSEDTAKKKQLKQLEGRGWLRRRAENNSLWIHPLIRNVFKNELKPVNADCEKFLSTLWSRLDDRYPQVKKLFRQAAILFENATKILDDENGDQHFRAGFCHIVSDNFVRALAMEEQALRLRKANAYQDFSALARNYNDAGAAACYVQDYAKGMNFFEKAIAILEEHLPDDPNSANVFANVANAYLFLGDYEKALTLGERAVKIFEMTPPKNKHEQAHAHSVFGNVLMWTKNFEEARTNFLTAVNILQKLAPDGSIELASAYLDLGQFYLTADDPSPGTVYLLKALAIQEKLLPKNHKDKIIVCKLLNEIYSKIGNISEAEKYFAIADEAMKANLERELKDTLSIALDAIELRSDKMSTEEFIIHFRTAAACYRQLGELEHAQKFLSAALEKIDDGTSPKEVAATYFESAKLHEAKKFFDFAIADFQKALYIEQNVAPDNFDRLSNNFAQLGELCYQVQKFKKALTYFDHSIKLQSKCAYPNHDFVKHVQKLIGMTLRELKRYDEARAVFKKLLVEWRTLLPDSHPTVKELADLFDSIAEK